jgi:hypothetical protein
MANPVAVACPKDTWTKVATNVTNGQVHKLDYKARYLRQYKDNGQAAPTDLSLAIPFDTDSTGISAAAGIDVYIYCQRAAGNVRVDL